MSDEFNAIEALSEAVTRLPHLEAENAELRESISEVRAMLSHEDQGWSIISGFASEDRLEGLDLDEVQEVARMIQPRVAAASLAGRAVDLHSGFVFGKGMTIDGVEEPKTAGRKKAIYSFYSDPDNQEALFSTSAHQELQKARFVEGNVLFACNKETQKVSRIPFSQITALRVDPDFSERVLAYKRTWETELANGKKETVSRWYVTRRYQPKANGQRHKTFPDGPGKSTPVDQDHVIVDLRANRQVGFALGIPDGLRGLHWSEAYTQHVRYGQVVTEALSKLLYKITSKTKAGAQQAGVKMAGVNAPGGAATMTEGQDVEAIRTAGNAYSFEKLRPIAALAAAAWNVSNADLLNDSAAAGSSYGALSGLVPGNRNAMTTMQRDWASVFQAIFDVMGHGRPAIHWEPMEAPDPYRAAQALTLLSAALDNPEYRGKALDILDIAGDKNTIPDVLKMRSAPPEPAGAASQQAAPDQGKSNGTGGGGRGANDQRTDTISSKEVFVSMQNEEFLDRMQALVERMEAASEGTS